MNRQFRIITFFLLMGIGILPGWTQTADSLYTPFSIEISEAQKRNYRFLGDLLTQSPGLRFRDLGLVGQVTAPLIGNSFEEEVKILIDGHPLTEAWSGLTDIFLIPVEMVEKIDVYPSNNPFGIAAPSGLINITTRNAPSPRPFTRFMYRTGSSNFGDLDVTYAQGITSKLSVIGGVLFEKYGEDLPNRSLDAQQTRFKIKYELSQEIQFQYALLHNRSELDIPYNLTFLSDSLTLSLYHRRRRRTDHQLFTKFNLGPTQNQLRLTHTAASHYYRKNSIDFKETIPIQTTHINFKQKVNGFVLPIEWGVWSSHNSFRMFDQPRFSLSHHQAFLNTVLKPSHTLLNVLNINLAFPAQGSATFLFSNRLNLRLSQSLSLWTGFHQGLRQPTLGEASGLPLYSTTPMNGFSIFPSDTLGSFTPNKDLEPEKTDHIELGARWETGEKVRGFLRGYYRLLKNKIIPDFASEQLQFINGPNSKLFGIESQIIYKPITNLTAELNLQYQGDMNTESLALFERSDIQGSVWVSWEHSFFQNDLHAHLTLGCRFWSDFQTLPIGVANSLFHINQKAGAVLDAKLFCTVIRNVTVSFGMDNILGNEYVNVSSFLMPLRSYRISVSWNLLD